MIDSTTTSTFSRPPGGEKVFVCWALAPLQAGFVGLRRLAGVSASLQAGIVGLRRLVGVSASL